MYVFFMDIQKGNEVIEVGLFGPVLVVPARVSWWENMAAPCHIALPANVQKRKWAGCFIWIDEKEIKV